MGIMELATLSPTTDVAKGVRTRKRSEPAVFVVDDDESVRKGLCRLLSSSGYKAEGFASVADYLKRGLSQRVHVLVLDVRMPGLGGLDLQRKLLSQGIRKPIIFVTAYDDARARAEAMKLGAIAFLRKPVDEQTLLRAIGGGISSLDWGEKDFDV
jgi:FixJ family two-component response regulator